MREMIHIVIAAIAVLTCAACVNVEHDEGSERFPISSDYPPGTMERISFEAPEHWRISALTTPPRPEATWKIVIITGTPSWSEYWAPTIAAAPASREVIVADRPGFAQSEPQDAVRDLMQQVEALSPMLEARPGERVVLIGQSFGAPIAALMAARHPERVQALVLTSPYFGDRGPTARRMLGVGGVVRGMLPRDLKNAVIELQTQAAQLPDVWEALRNLDQPLVFIHGDADTFVPFAASERIAAEYHHTLIRVPGGDHFLNACCVPALLGAVEQAIAEAEGREAAEPPSTQNAAR